MKLAKYDIVEQIFSSKLSNVYKAVDTHTQTTVAIKELKTDNPWQENSFKRFYREYQFLEMVQSDYVVSAIEYIEKDGKAYIVLEYAPGISLEQILQQKIVLSLEKKLQLAIEVSRAVATLSHTGIIHRDIKPDNIIVNLQDMSIKMIDLGIGKLSDHQKTKLTQTDFILGTCAYISPEQSFGTSSVRSDVFALGITLYQVFFNVAQSPFDAQSITDIFIKTLVEDLPDIPLDRFPEKEQIVYKGIFTILQGATQKFPHCRWPSPKPMVEMFELILAHRNEITDEHFMLFTPQIPKVKYQRESAQKMCDILLEYGKLFYRQYDLDYSLCAFEQILKVFPNHSEAKEYREKTLERIRKIPRRL